MSADGIVTLLSQYSVAETIDRLAAAAEAAGLRIFARIDHGRNAAEIGAPLRPTELLIFGHPTGGTPLMQYKQTAGIDLPVKALAFEDADRRVWLAYYDAHWLAERHGLSGASHDNVEAIQAGMQRLTKSAVAREAD